MKNNALLIRMLVAIRDCRLLWDTLGPIYNRRIHGAIAELYDHIAAEMTSPKYARILDVGSGRGYISLEVARRNPSSQITGIDYSPSQVREALKLRNRSHVLNCAFQTGNAMDIPFDDQTFDAAVSIGSIKHWPDALRGLKEIHRILKPGGQLLISETDQEASDSDLQDFIKRFQVWFVPDRLLFWGLRHVIFGQSYSEKKLADAVRRAGFSDVACRKVARCPYVIIKARR